MDAWGIVETLVLLIVSIILGGFGWLVNYAVASRRRTGEMEKQVAVAESRIRSLEAVATKLDEHTTSCTETNNQVKAEINTVKTSQAVTNALLKEVKDGQDKIVNILDGMRK